jgi:hypothetical protein
MKYLKKTSSLIKQRIKTINNKRILTKDQINSIPIFLILWRKNPLFTMENDLIYN